MTTKLIQEFTALDVGQRQAEARRLASGTKPEQRQFHAIMAWLLDNDPEEWRALTATTEACFRL